MSLGIAMSYAMMVPLVWLTNMDTGVVFCRREDFEAIGGYNEKRLFAEDVELLLALIKRGRARGQKLVRVRPVKTITSTRKWDKHGEWHYFGLMFRGACSPFLSAKTIERWARAYWYEDRK